MPGSARALDLAVRALGSRERSRSELTARLERAGVPSDEREETLAQLERLGYLDDRRFAVARAEALAGRGYGDEWIRHDLAGHGVAGEEADEALAALAPELDRALDLAAREGPGRRLAARLQRKGFGADAVEAAAGGAFADGGERA